MTLTYFKIEIKSTNFELFDTLGANNYRKLVEVIILAYDPMKEKYFKETRNNQYNVYNKKDLNEKIIKEGKGKIFAESA